MERGADAGSMRAARTVAVTVRELYDRAEIRAWLAGERAYSAYPLGQLEPNLYPLVTCWLADSGAGQALVLFSRGGLGDAVFMSGSAEGVDAILAVHPGPRGNFATFRLGHLPVVERHFRVASPTVMSRMEVDRAAFRLPLHDRRGVHVRRLLAADARAVNRLYSAEGQPTHYSGTHIEQGLYHGVFEDRRLVAVAGTHVISPTEQIAVVGNVFTHPGWRSLGYGTLVTAATTATLLEFCTLVTLTVDPTNTPAVRSYLRLGYTEHSRLVESPITRRSVSGLLPFFASSLARWRGRADGTELVVRRIAR